MRLLKAMVQKDEATVNEMFPNAGQPDGDLYDTGLKIVVPDGDSPLKAEMFDSRTRGSSICRRVRQWLSEYIIVESS